MPCSPGLSPKEQVYTCKDACQLYKVLFGGGGEPKQVEGVFLSEKDRQHKSRRTNQNSELQHAQGEDRRCMQL